PGAARPAGVPYAGSPDVGGDHLSAGVHAPLGGLRARDDAYAQPPDAPRRRGVVPAGGRDTKTFPNPFWTLSILWSTGAVPHGTRSRRNVAALSTRCQRPARGHRPLYSGGDVDVAWRIA